MTGAHYPGAPSPPPDPICPGHSRATFARNCHLYACGGMFGGPRACMMVLKGSFSADRVLLNELHMRRAPELNLRLLSNVLLCA